MRIEQFSLKHFRAYALTALIVIFGGTLIGATLAEEIKQVSLPHNIGQVEALGTFNDGVYVGARPTGTYHATLWKSPDGAMFTDITGTLAISNPRNLITFNNDFYLLGNNSSSHSAAVWRSHDGTSFDLVVDNAFRNFKDPVPSTYIPNIDIPACAIFNGNLYVGTRNVEDTGTGGEVWRSSDGTNWFQSGQNGLGDPNNSRIGTLVVFKGQLYAATRNDILGAQVYRTIDGATWEKVVGSGAQYPAGFGDPQNNGIFASAVFNNYLYRGLQKRGSQSALLWRTPDGDTWNLVDGGSSSNAKNLAIDSLAIYNDKLFVGTKNKNQGAELWSNTDGSNWNLVADVGFGNATVNKTIRSMTVYSDSLYIGTGNDEFGSVSQGEVWKLTASTSAHPPAPPKGLRIINGGGRP